MGNKNPETPKKVVIATANPLFGKGLYKLIQQRWQENPIEIRMTSSMADTLQIVEQWHPDLVVVDSDDRTIDRHEFLNFYVSGDQPMQVMLVSLNANGAVVVYDRKTYTPDEMNTWLNPLEDQSRSPVQKKGMWEQKPKKGSEAL